MGCLRYTGSVSIPYSSILIDVAAVKCSSRLRKWGQGSRESDMRLESEMTLGVSRKRAGVAEASLVVPLSDIFLSRLSRGSRV